MGKLPNDEILLANGVIRCANGEIRLAHPEIRLANDPGRLPNDRRRLANGLRRLANDRWKRVFSRVRPGGVGVLAPQRTIRRLGTWARRAVQFRTVGTRKAGAPVIAPVDCLLRKQ